jgi:hypothetical protein
VNPLWLDEACSGAGSLAVRQFVAELNENRLAKVSGRSFAGNPSCLAFALLGPMSVNFRKHPAKAAVRCVQAAAWMAALFQCQGSASVGEGC